MILDLSCTGILLYRFERLLDSPRVAPTSLAASGDMTKLHVVPVTEIQPGVTGLHCLTAYRVSVILREHNVADYLNTVPFPSLKWFMSFDIAW